MPLSCVFHNFHQFFRHIIIAASRLQGPLRYTLLLISGTRLNKKEQLMKRITKITLFALGLAGLAVMAFLGLPAMVKAAGENSVDFDVACDCRTGATLDAGIRGSPFIIQGKIFPAGTLPSGTATNDPTQPVHGVAPIGNWICRGQVSFPFPPAIAPAYSSTPAAFNTQYFILNESRALTVEGYDVLPSGERLSVTGGIGSFRGASGDIEEGPMGTNATGCPNFRAKFHIQPGSVRPN
jgi:hypothetical protein